MLSGATVSATHPAFTPVRSTHAGPAAGQQHRNGTANDTERRLGRKTDSEHGQPLAGIITIFMPPTVGKGKRCFCPSVRLSVCPSVAYIANNSRTQRPKFGRNVPHLRCDSHTSFKVKRSKVRVRGGRGHTVSAETGGHTACLPVRLILQEAMLSQRGRAMLRVRPWLASTVQYLERSLLLLVTSASDLPMHSLAYSRPCCRGYDKHGPLMRGGLRGGIIIRTR